MHLRPAVQQAVMDVTFDAPCPHGRVVEWRTRAPEAGEPVIYRIDCDCEEEPWTV